MTSRGESEVTERGEGRGGEECRSAFDDGALEVGDEGQLEVSEDEGEKGCQGAKSAGLWKRVSLRISEVEKRNVLEKHSSAAMSTSR